jgi:hypothetical protein
LVSLGAAAGCSGTSGDPTGSSLSASTSSQDVEVARLRGAFAGAPASALPSRLSSISTTGVTTTFRNCTERSAKKDDTSKRTVSYVLKGNGHDLDASGTGFGKIFVKDATQGATNPPDVVGYPASVVSEDDVVLDVARMTSDESLVIERIVKPAVDDTFDSSVYERSVYGDPRAYAIAYVSCSVNDRQFDGGGRSNVLYYDDCKDPTYSKAYWNGIDICHGSSSEAQRTLARSPQGYEMKVAQPPSYASFIIDDRYHGLYLSLNYGELQVRSRAASTAQTVSFPTSATTLRVEFSGGNATVFVDGGVGATIPTGAADATPIFYIASGITSELTIW